MTRPKTDRQLLRLISIRARAMFTLHGIKRSLLDCRMDLEVVHEATPLRLKELLEAPDFDFAHDIAGIAQHLNHDTFELDNCFVPRFIAH